MLNYATRLPPGKPVTLLSNGMIRKKIHTSSYQEVHAIAALINYFEKYSDTKVVAHSNFKIIENDNHYSYQYDMIRCGLLPSEERIFINLVGDIHDLQGRYAFQHPDIRSEKEKFPKLNDFLEQVVSENRYWDLHSGNVMLNEDWDYVLIDLEGFIRHPLLHHDNNWFRV